MILGKEYLAVPQIVFFFSFSRVMLFRSTPCETCPQKGWLTRWVNQPFNKKNLKKFENSFL
jgi:hypothetical protein